MYWIIAAVVGLPVAVFALALWARGRAAQSDPEHAYHD